MYTGNHSNMSKFIPVTKARKNFFKVIEDSSIPGNPTAITVDGVPKVMMMSYDEFEGWMETMEIMSDPELVKGIKKGEDDFKKGNFITLEELERELSQEPTISDTDIRKRKKKSKKT